MCENSHVCISFLSHCNSIRYSTNIRDQFCYQSRYRIVLGTDRADLEALADVDPEGDKWDDLDAKDVSNPLMVSKYVEIFQYMKEIKVSLKLLVALFYLIHF